MTDLNKPELANDVNELMKVVENGFLTGINFHIYKRKRIPSWDEFGEVTDEGWEAFTEDLRSDVHWNAENEIAIAQKLGLPKAKRMHIIHLDQGATVYRNWEGLIALAYDYDCESGFVNELTMRIKTVCKKSTTHEIGFLQSNGARVYVKYFRFKPYKHDLVPYMGEQVLNFRNQVLTHINKENGNGLYLLYGKPGTGKTSFIKSILSHTDRKAIYISTSMTGTLTSPDMIGLLMDYPDSILVIEDAETTLMKRAGDNSSAVSNLLNMSDGFPADFLNLCIFCTFNTELDNIDPALLRKGRLKGMFEFKPLQQEQAELMADVLGVSKEINGPVTIAELCNSDRSGFHYQNKNMGFRAMNNTS